MASRQPGDLIGTWKPEGRILGSFGGSLPGFDQGVAAAEFWGFLMVALALVAAGCEWAVIFIANLLVGNIARRLLTGSPGLDRWHKRGGLPGD